ncbi:YhcH/YjgK/YiaL family protein [Capnocytophaga cynodegmi]|uniref:YhcH/YjgK/YiaL family protein n=1 Tax=Capnocytophaga cynodegmi TaxID=28189 RepID=A0A250E642_9FLAO|nr:YhcH/YjgK/YiaL family protein [Capnocytophaga cynodegmi]ATA68439.1 YhcH/YjgK/YiaL family protein [Capnocytophaga cynodegmi]
MILSDLSQSSRYEGLHSAFPKVFQYVKSHNLLNAELGKIEIDGDKVFIINSEPECLSKENQVLEYHRKYLDIHILLSGEETIGWKNLAHCKQEKKAFDEENDYGLYEDKPTTYITLKPNQFAIVYPEDAHAPIIGEGKIRKLVVKISVE